MDERITAHFEGINNEILTNTLFEINKYFDKDLKKYYKEYKEKNGVTLDSFQRKMLKNYFYYNQENVLEELGIQEFPKIKYNNEQLRDIEEKTITKIEGKNSEKIINSIKTRVKEINKYNTEKEKSQKWLEKYSNYETPSLIILNINQKLIDKLKENYESKIYSIINNIYEKLANYRHVAIVMKENIIVNNQDITWDLLSNIAIYMENFIEFKGKFKAFHKNKKIQEMNEFLKNKINGTEYKKDVEEFYNSISTGFTFNDLLISEDEKEKVLIMRKIKLDERQILCPACLKATSRGNSYPLIFLKSWECQNPDCPERSKSGRGKRYDEYGVYRYFKLVENNTNNIIDRQMYIDWHRDIFNPKLDIYQMLIMYYTWNQEKVYIINDEYIEEYKTRTIVKQEINEEELQENISIENLKIYQYLNKINEYIIENRRYEKEQLKEELIIKNEDSTTGINKIEEGTIGAAITSPPYYNAREYSSWPNFITYLIDMMSNAKAIYNASAKDATYLYNVGDIVDTDNVYISSNMSKRRIMLGFYSTLAFKIAGFKLTGNIIWDKGEVESKRNSTVNLCSGYVKYVNCYEHILIFKKEYEQISESKVCKIKPVYKINSKGENILGHTAPYPIELVELIKPYVNKNLYVLDPFLGSGTTGIWCKINGYKFIGYEINKNYFELCEQRINKGGATKWENLQ